MPKIKVKQMDDRIASQGVHMGGDMKRRKLEPGEVVYIPDDFEVDGQNLFDALWATGKIELSMEDATRPLDYETYEEARYCSPSFKAREPSEERDSELAREAVAARLAEPAEAEPEIEETDDAPAPPPAARAKRAQRRATARGKKNGEKAQLRA